MRIFLCNVNHLESFLSCSANEFKYGELLLRRRGEVKRECVCEVPRRGCLGNAAEATVLMCPEAPAERDLSQ